MVFGNWPDKFMSRAVAYQSNDFVLWANQIESKIVIWWATFLTYYQVTYFVFHMNASQAAQNSTKLG